MLTALNDIILKIADPLLCWLLWLPTDVVLILVGVATGAPRYTSPSPSTR